MRRGHGLRSTPRLQTQALDDGDRERLADLGKNGPRDVSGLTMTHCVPNERVVVGG